MGSLPVDALLVLASLPVSAYAMYKAGLGVLHRGRPWEIGLPGIGGGVTLWGVVLLYLEPRVGARGDLDVALILFGVALMTTPKLWGVLTREARHG